MTGCVWEVASFSDEADERSRALADSLGIPLLVARVLSVRGIADPDEAGSFIRADLDDLLDPFLLTDMDKGVSRTMRAIRDDERIRIYGDYDVDGITSICVLLNTLRSLGANADYYIPGRLDEGYGLNPEAIRKAQSSGTSVLITVDCGIAAFKEVEFARELGIDVIVTDHHEPHDALPNAVAVIDPKRRDSRYAFSELAGVGVAFKFAHALLMAAGGTLDALKPPHHLLDLVALGTIADVAPLRGENRILAKHGLRRMNDPDNLGLGALIRGSGLAGREISAGTVGFVIAPRLNAAGRLADASLCVELLTTDSPERAADIARLLERANEERQALEQAIFEEAVSMVKARDDGEAADTVLVLAGEGWHAGVIGIVASKLAERFCRPAILISLDGDEGRGSGRSIAPFDLYEGLCQCAKWLHGFGGHRHAAGLVISRDAVGEFRREMNEVGQRTLRDEDFVRRAVCDFETTLDEVDLATAEWLSRLAPFGVANPTPLFLSKGVRLVEYRGVGKDARHLKLKLFENGTTRDGIGFGLGGMAPALFARGVQDVDIIYTIEVNEWNGTKTAQLNIKGLREAASSS